MYIYINVRNPKIIYALKSAIYKHKESPKSFMHLSQLFINIKNSPNNLCTKVSKLFKLLEKEIIIPIYLPT